MSLAPSAVGRAELRCAEVYSQRKRFQLSVTAIITIWPEAISQGWLALNLSHEQKLHVHAAYCLSPDLSLLGPEWTTGPQFLVTHQMKCAFLSNEIYCHLEPGDAKIMAVDGHHRAVASISMISMLCKKKKKELGNTTTKKNTKSAVVCYKYVFWSKSTTAVCSIWHL